jgi:hypothetical protein
MGAAASIGNGMDDPNLDEHQKAELFTALKVSTSYCNYIYFTCFCASKGTCTLARIFQGY